ncbi:hypothetical protein F0251_14990 [Vibrio sp. 070316B]|nr:hypothetical protein [Vibrio sp. 070316B]
MFYGNHNTRYEIRDTRYEIRDTRYEIRDTMWPLKSRHRGNPVFSNTGLIQRGEANALNQCRFALLYFVPILFCAETLSSI